MKKFIYILLFAGIIGAMCITPIKSEILGDFGIKDILGEKYNNIFLIVALGLAVILPLFLFLASLGKPRHIRNMFMFAIIAAIVFIGWPYLFRIGFNLEAQRLLGGLKFNTAFDIVKESVKGDNPFKLGTGAIIAGCVACAGVLLSIIFKATGKGKKNRR